MRDVATVANKIEREEDAVFVRAGLPRDLPILCELPFDRSVERQARAGGAGRHSEFVCAMETLIDRLGPDS